MMIASASTICIDVLPTPPAEAKTETLERM